MLSLVAGLTLFFGAHLVPAAPGAKARLAARVGGEGRFKGLFSIAAGLGLALLIVGYGQAPYIELWTPPVWTRHLALALMLPAVILLVAAYAPAGRIKAAVKHPMLAGVKVWSLAHLLANGDLASLLLFGSFLAYGVIDRISVARRERAGLIRAPAAGPARNDAVAVGLGVAVYAGILFWSTRR